MVEEGESTSGTRSPHSSEEAALTSNQPEIAFNIRDLTVRYRGRLAIEGVTMAIPERQITALIGASACGKSSILKVLNRIHDLNPHARVEGKVEYHGVDLYAPRVDPTEVRRLIGMVFQRANTFPKSIYDNVAFGLRIQGIKRKLVLDDLIEHSLRRAALWDEVKRQLSASALELSGGQQQRLCIARALATSPQVILMDEPCSALDPVATLKVEAVMRDLITTGDYADKGKTIVLVTHNMQQAARVADMTAYIGAEQSSEDGEHRFGKLVEFDTSNKIFNNPSDQRTEAYITGHTP